jgi:hypothetical protein
MGPELAVKEPCRAVFRSTIVAAPGCSRRLALAGAYEAVLFGEELGAELVLVIAQVRTAGFNPKRKP